MTDRDIALVAQQLAVSNRQLIIEEIDRRFRIPTGVDSGGPFTSFSTNDQGQIIDAGSGVIAVAGTSGSTTVTTTPHRINFDGILSDPDGIITTGASWAATVTTPGWYKVYTQIYANQNSQSIAQFDQWSTTLRKGGTGTVNFLGGTTAALGFWFWFNSKTAASLTIHLLGQSYFEVLTAPADIYVSFDRNSTTNNRTIDVNSYIVIAHA